MPHHPLSDSAVTIRRQPAGPLPQAFFELSCQALDEDISFVAAFTARWTGRGDQFSRPGEGMFGAWAGGDDRPELAGLAGVMRDPYLDDPWIARLRHVYVAPAHRGRGIAEALVRACLRQAAGHFRLMRLNAVTGNAARLYERLGFRPVDDGQRATHLLTMDE